MKLTDKRVLITGAAVGIGRAIASRFAAEGAGVTLVDTDASNLDIAVSELENTGGKAIGVVGDVASPADVSKAVSAATSEFGGLDILVNNAGISTAGSADNVSIENWNRVIAVNLTSVFLLSKAVWPRFAAQGHGAILNMSSIMGLTGAPGSFAYSATKAAIIGMTKSMAADGAPNGIRVNCICPGYVSTPTMDRVHSADMQARICQQIPMRRMAMPEEVAAAALYLVSDDALYASGTVLVLDGSATAGFAGCYL